MRANGIPDNEEDRGYEVTRGEMYSLVGWIRSSAVADASADFVVAGQELPAEDN